MEKYNLSLVLFTWLTQASVGLLILRSIYVRQSQNDKIKTYITGHFMLTSAFIMLVAGLILSFTHLHYPAHAYNAINNLGSSWMSREILAETILLFTVLVWYIVNRMRIRQIPVVIPETIAIVSGIVLVYFMIRTYMLPSIPELHNPSFPVSFIITPALGGASLVFFFIRKKEPAYAERFRLIASIAFVLSFINHLLFLFLSNSYLLDSPVTFVYIAGIILLIVRYYPVLKNKTGISDVIFLSLAIVCDLLFRVLTLTFTNPGI